MMMDQINIDLTQSIVARPDKFFQPGKFEHLDSLRGLLCLNVVLVHAGQLMPVQSMFLKQYLNQTTIVH